MKTITVNKKDLIKRLHENKRIHINAYEQLLVDRSESAVIDLEAAIAEIKAGKEPETQYYFKAIESHEDDYDRAAEMLEWSTAETAELSETEFRNLVQDDWDWKQDMLISQAFYSNNKNGR